MFSAVGRIGTAVLMGTHFGACLHLCIIFVYGYYFTAFDLHECVREINRSLILLSSLARRISVELIKKIHVVISPSV